MAGETAFPLVDTHAHLTWSSFSDLAAVLERAHNQGVVRILTAGIDLESSRQASTLADTHSTVFAAAGIHPNDIQEDDDLEQLKILVDRPGVVAVGETGLDYFRHRATADLQRVRFDQQLAIAEEVRKPVIIHNRDADADVLSAIERGGQHLRGVLHCFSSTQDVADRALACGFFVSFAGNLTYPSATMLREVAARIPEDRILVETDAPFLSPLPHRGQRNEPAHVLHTLNALSLCRKVDPQALALTIEANARTLFGW